VKTGLVSAAAIGVAGAATQQPNRSSHPASEAGSGLKVACSTAAWREGSSVSLRQAMAEVAAAHTQRRIGLSCHFSGLQVAWRHAGAGRGDGDLWQRYTT
jgi:hypothetical protein